MDTPKVLGSVLATRPAHALIGASGVSMRANAGAFASLCGSERAPCRIAALLALLACALAVRPGPAWAQTTWDNTGTEWTSGTSWVGDAAPADNAAAGNVAVFSNVAADFNTVNLGANRLIYGLYFGAGANSYTFTGSNITFGGAYGISNFSSSVQTFSNRVIQASNSSSSTSGVGSYIAGGSLVFAGGINLSANNTARTLKFGGIGDITVSGVIANGGTGAGNVEITNTALTIFSGNNTYGGTTTVNAGATLRLGHSNALGATNGFTYVLGALDLNGQTIVGETMTNSGTGVSSSGSLFNSSASAATWNGSLTPSASSTFKATNGSITLSGGIDLNNNGATSRTLTLDGTGGFIVSGNISNSFALSTGNLTIAATASNVTLSGSNSYNGTTTLTAGGAMNINSAYAISTNTFDIGSTAFLNNTSGGAITNLGNNNITLGSDLTFGASGSTAANSLNLGTGTVTASSSRTITIAGTGVTLGLGTLDSTSTSTARTFTASGAGNTLSLAGWKIQSGSTNAVTAKLAGTANWTITGPIVNGNAFSNGVQIDATGLTTFGGNNTYDGTTIVSSNATLRITSATGLGTTNTGTTVSTGGQLQLSGGITVDAGEALTLNGGTGAAASLRNISGDNLYNGAITFAGTNRIDSDAGTLTLSSFANTLSSTRSLLVGGAGNTIFTGRFTGTGSSIMTKDGAGTLTLSSTNFDIGGGVFVNAGTLALAANDALGATRAVAVNGGTVDIAGFNNTVGAVSLTNGSITGTTGVLTGTSYAVENGTISANLGGSGVLTKSTAGTVTLSGANTYSGGTLVSAGVLSGDTTGLQGAITNNAAVIFNQATNGTFAYVLSGSGTLLKTNAGTLILINVNTQSGGTTIGQGTLQIGNGGSSVSLAGNITNNGTLAYNLAGASTQSTVISGSGAVTKAGAGTVTLSGANTYSGGTLVSAGVLAGDTTSLQGNITNNATTTFSQTANGAYLGTMSGSGALTKSGAGTVTLGAANSYDGATTVSAGALTISNGSALGSATGGTTVAAGAALQLQGGITVSGEALGLSGTNGDAASLRNISGNNTYNGAITFTAGTNRIDSDGGTLVLSSFATGNALTSAKSLFVGGAGDTIFTGSLTGSSSSTITKDGSGILTLSNTWVSSSAGGTVVADGTLRLGINQAITNNLRVTGSGATLDLGVYNTAVGAVTLSNGTITGTTGVLTGSSYAVENGTISAILGGSGALTKSTAGTVTFSGANTFSGGITNSAGTLRAQSSSALSSGAVQNAGTLEIAAAISKNNITNSGAVSVVAGGSLTANSLGAGSTGALTLSGVSTNRAVFTDTATAGTTSAPTVLNVGSLTLGGNSTIALQNIYNTIIASNTVTISNTGNFLSIAGLWASGATYNLLTGSNGLSASGISLTNALWGSSISLGGSNTLGRTTYLFDTNATTLFLTVSGQAGNIAWNGASSGLWNYDELNTPWTNNADGTTSAFYVGDSVTLGTPDSTITVDAGGVSAGAMSVNNASGTVALSGGAITNTSFAKSGAGAATIANGMVSLGGLSMSAGGLTLNGTTTVAGSLALSGGTIDGAGTITASNGYALTNGSIAAALAGSGALTKAGAETVTLSGINTYSGTSTVSAGALRVAGNSALGSTAAGTTVANGAALELSGGISVGAESLNLSGTGISSGGALRNISGNNSYGGLITLGAASRINSDAGTLTLTNTGTITGAGLALSLGGAGNITLNSSIGTTTGSLTKDGAGTVTLNGINTYTGNTTLASGTLIINGTNSGGGTITITNSSSRLVLNSTNALSASTSLAGASSSGAVGTLDLAAAGNYTLNRYTVNSMNFTNSSGSAATLTFTNATNTITPSTDTSSARSLTNSSTDLDIIFSGAVDIGSINSANITLGGAGHFNINGSVFNTGAGVRGLTKTGSGTLTLAASNNYNGVTTISGGTLRISNSSALGTTGNGTTVADGADLQLVGGITVGAEALNLSGTGISSGGALRNISGNNTYGGTITNTLASRINSDAGLLTLSGAINATNQALTFGGAGNIAVSGAITNSTSTLTKDGAGTLTLSGANTYSGGTLVSAGALAGDTTGLQGAITNNAAVIFNQSTDGTFASVLSGSGTLLKTNAGTLILTNANTQSGGTTIGQGTLQIGDGGSTGSLAGNITNNGTLAYNLSSTNLAQSTVISGSGAVTKAGAGTVTLSGANTYSGGTLVSAGVLAGDTTSLQGLITNSATLVFNQSGDGTFSSVISGTGALIKTNAGTLTLSGLNTYSGATAINAGTLAINGTNTGSGKVTLSASNSVLKLGRTNALANGVLVGAGSSANTGTVDLTVGGNHSIASYGDSGTAAGNINFTNSSGSAATLTFSAATNYVTSGNNGGRTVANNSTNLTLVFSGDVDISSSAAGNVAFSGAGNTLVSGGIVNNSNGVRSLVKNGVGTLTLAGANTYNGATTISAGTLQLGNGGTSGALGTNSVSVATNSLLLFNRSDSFAVSNNISGAGSLTKSGNGTLTLAGSNTYTGGTLVGSGVLAGNATSLQGFITNNGSVVFEQSVDGTYAGAMSGSGTLVKNGSGTVTLAAANSFSGGTTLNAGILQVSNNAALGTGTLTIGDGTTFASAVGRRNIPNTLVIAGNFTLGTGSAATTFTGGTDLGGATRAISLVNSVLFSGVISNGGLSVNDISADAPTAGNHNINLAGANTFAGGIAIGNYVNLRLDNVNAAGTGAIVQSNGTSLVQINVSGTITNDMSLYSVLFQQGANLSGALALNNTVFDVVDGVTATNSGTLSGTGGVDKIGAGTLIISGNNSYSGGTSISNGAVSISADSNLGAVPGSPSAGNVTLDGGKLIATSSFALGFNRGLALGSSGGTIEVASGQALTYAGVAAGSGGFTKSGAGSLAMSGANTFTGATTISAGTLELASTTGSALGSTASVGVATNATLLISRADQVTNSASVSLTGGTIRTASGVSETFGNLSITGSGILDFGTTSYANANTIGFGAYSYTPSALLTINNFNYGSTMTFGQNLNGTDLSTFSFNNGGIASTSWDGSTFTITAIPEPSTYLAAAGLLGLMLWPSRRRIVRDARRVLGLTPPMRDRLARKGA